MELTQAARGFIPIQQQTTACSRARLCKIILLQSRARKEVVLSWIKPQTSRAVQARQVGRRMFKLEQAAPARLVVRHENFNRNNLRYMPIFSLCCPISQTPSHLFSVPYIETTFKRPEDKSKTQPVKAKRFSGRAKDEKMVPSWS